MLSKDAVLADTALFQEALEVIRNNASRLDRNTFGCQLQKVLALFIDGHTRMSHVLRVKGDLPFLTELLDDNILALSLDRNSFLDKDYPYLTKLDGRDIQEWVSLTQTLFPKSSPQYLRSNAVEMLRHIQHWRLESNQELKDTVEVELSDGKKTITKRLEVLLKSQPRPKRTDKASHLLENNLGYLRLSKMDDEAVETIHQWMPIFKNTNGLIIDVRGNGGGSRAALRELFPYFMAEQKPVVASVAVYCLWEEFEDDHLAARYMYRFENEQWHSEEREAIEAFRQTFKPVADFPEDKFSDWHYLVLSRRNNPNAYSYDKPVVILMDTKCFSATDIFLGAMKGRKNITLLGQPSSGGSGFAIPYDLPKSGLKFRVASMLSFQPNGQLYDTLGIQPDLHVLPEPQDFISESDAVLSQAIQHVFNKI